LNVKGRSPFPQAPEHQLHGSRSDRAWRTVLRRPGTFGAGGGLVLALACGGEWSRAGRGGHVRRCGPQTL